MYDFEDTILTWCIVPLIFESHPHRYTTDVISSCVFGLQSESQKDENSVFRKMGRRVFAPSRRSQIIGLISAVSPKIRRFLGLQFIEKEVAEFFRSTVSTRC